MWMMERVSDHVNDVNLALLNILSFTVCLSRSDEMHPYLGSNNLKIGHNIPRRQLDNIEVGLSWWTTVYFYS